MNTNELDLKVIYKKTSAATLYLIPILLLLIILIILESPSESNYQSADPLIRLLPYPWVSIFTVLIGLITIFFWIKTYTPNKTDILAAGKWSLIGSALTISAVGLLYLINGPEIPEFIPPEESSSSGLLLGLSAGVLEEILFRLTILPLLITLFAKNLSTTPAVILAILITSILFSLSHELAGDPFEVRYLITRFLMPGLVMSVLFIKFHPAVIIIGHSVSHIAIALLLTST